MYAPLTALTPLITGEKSNMSPTADFMPGNISLFLKWLTVFFTPWSVAKLCSPVTVPIVCVIGCDKIFQLIGKVKPTTVPAVAPIAWDLAKSDNSSEEAPYNARLSIIADPGDASGSL